MERTEAMDVDISLRSKDQPSGGCAGISEFISWPNHIWWGYCE
jgi:hypothetical protein